ncbi:hypothetical protein NW762_003301 [Fusarium torreyae]|uniref:F-box domain-containing protein n=1 Tax=Fusarium torreyae TaxID=1237075 RepID=A0A9W8VKX8_9HYPO|nr:hypothetical protein NW762_003301 [Fusarium torreyae]
MTDFNAPPTLAAMPTEILCMIGSNLSGNELGSIARASRRFRQIFITRVFENIKFSGNMGRLTEQLASLLYGSSVPVMTLIKPFIKYATFQIQGVTAPDDAIPSQVSKAGLTLISIFLRTMPQLKGAVFDLHLPHTQQVQFSRQLREAPRLYGPPSLRFLNSVEISGLNAILRNYNTAPGAVQIPAWHGTRSYKAVRDRCPTLKALHLSRGYERKHRLFRSMDHKILELINRDFNQLESLVLHEATSAHEELYRGQFKTPKHFLELNRMIDRLIVSLNAMPQLRRFAFTMWYKRLDKRLIRADWSRQAGREPLVDADLEDYYSALINHISKAVPRLEELCITVQDPVFYSGKRINGQSDMMVEVGSFEHASEKYRFPSVLIV